MHGKLIVLEGLDGSGKHSQANMLHALYDASNIKNRLISFPAYEKESSALVRMYLSGQLGSTNEVNAYAASMFYASDRYINYITDWSKDYKDGYTIIADRYSTSNLVYQMAKLPAFEWDRFIEWIQDYEHTKILLPRPRIVIYLDVDPNVSKRLMERRYQDDECKKDIHEKDFEYQLQCREAGRYTAFKLGWRIIDCCKDNMMLEPIEIFTKIYECLKEVEIYEHHR